MKFLHKNAKSRKKTADCKSDGHNYAKTASIIGGCLDL
jgi:hypothetical protein